MKSKNIFLVIETLLKKQLYNKQNNKLSFQILSGRSWLEYHYF